MRRRFTGVFFIQFGTLLEAKSANQFFKEEKEK